MEQLYYKYWGKARKKEDGSGYDYHLLPYHCLDVAAVGKVWWESSRTIRNHFMFITGNNFSEEKLLGWLCFFLSLHDFGKFDIRFQMKEREILSKCWQFFSDDELPFSGDSKNYSHGESGYQWFLSEYETLLSITNDDNNLLDKWGPWVSAVTGHHGVIPQRNAISSPDAEDFIVRHDSQARKSWFENMEQLFIGRSGISLTDNLPAFLFDNLHYLAGFCSISDWIGSNGNYYKPCNAVFDLEKYFNNRRLELKEENVLKEVGVIQYSHAYKGINILLPANKEPQQIQTLVNDLPAQAGLTIIEAATGSGKTEAALAYVWRLLEAGIADSIIFALPTQATANAMLERLEKFANKIFEPGSALVLAHGKACFHEGFKKLKAKGKSINANIEDAIVQCTAWLSESRKRVFLGQIGICTIDQVLLSVLPLKHQFVRGFGIMKSALIVDEVHAYDCYMYGLLEAVLKNQYSAGGSVVLLSATLPHHQRQRIAAAWNTKAQIEIKTPYPLVMHISRDGNLQSFFPDSKNQPPKRDVETEIIESKELVPSEKLLERMINAAQKGARVALVCNLVAIAQETARKIELMNQSGVDILHSRYRFIDRQNHEKKLNQLYGKDADPLCGRIVIATQVVEQSLDLDFDWLITQLCPVDLLFQRMGRLHRHIKQRPAGFEKPFCTILISPDAEYGLHKVIYGNTRVLWRTEQLLRKQIKHIIHFPKAYRNWINKVYSVINWKNEPENIQKEYLNFEGEQIAKRQEAKRLVGQAMNPLNDTDDKVNVLTRDGEMNLSVIPIEVAPEGEKFLDDILISNIPEYDRPEFLNLNSIPVPASWKHYFPCAKEDGFIYVSMLKQIDGSWEHKNGNVAFIYTEKYGLEKRDL